MTDTTKSVRDSKTSLVSLVENARKELLSTNDELSNLIETKLIDTNKDLKNELASLLSKYKSIGNSLNESNVTTTRLNIDNISDKTFDSLLNEINNDTVDTQNQTDLTQQKNNNKTNTKQKNKKFDALDSSIIKIINGAVCFTFLFCLFYTHFTCI